MLNQIQGQGKNLPLPGFGKKVLFFEGRFAIVGKICELVILLIPSPLRFPSGDALPPYNPKTMTIAFEKRLVVSKDVLVQELGGESVLLNLNGGRYFGLDEVGTRMWQWSAPHFLVHPKWEYSPYYRSDISVLPLGGWPCRPRSHSSLKCLGVW